MSVSSPPAGPVPAAPAPPRPAPAPAAATRSPTFTSFVPLVLMAATMLLWLGFQFVQLLGERSALSAAHAAQQQPVDNSARLRASLDALAADTQRLADSGNPNAGVLVVELRKRGITINPNVANPPTAAASR